MLADLDVFVIFKNEYRNIAVHAFCLILFSLIQFVWISLFFKLFGVIWYLFLFLRLSHSVAQADLEIIL